MRPIVLLGAVAAALMCSNGIALAQKSGGVLKMYHRDNPPSASIHEEATNSTVIPFMPLFNNLVLYDQGKPQNSPQDIVPDLAKSWSWSADKKDLTFKLQEGVKWHDGQPFTAKDVVCTFDLLTGKAEDKLRRNPRKSWYGNVENVTANGDYEVTVHLKRPQPWLLSLLASGFSPIYPCHITPAQMRTKPIGTGPFKFVEFKQNEGIKITKNTDYWKKGRPYLDGIEFTIVPNRATAMLSFVSGRFDITFPWEVTIPLLKDIKSQMPNAVCEVTSMNNSTNLILNRDAAALRQSGPAQGAGAGHRPQVLHRHPQPGQRRARRHHAAAVGRRVGPAEGDLRSRAGLRPGRAEEPRGGARDHEETGLRPRQAPAAQDRDPRHLALQGPGGHPRQPAQGDLDRRRRRHHRDLAVVPPVARKDYQLGLNTTGNGVDDPDQNYYENFSCKSERNYTGYCNPEIEKLFDVQSAEPDIEKRKKIVWEIDRKLLEDGARPIIMWNRAAICMQPYVKGYVAQVNSVYNGFRFEDVWLDK